jgi:EAL domain-containing protein (putative c-di-GMP-specific phosphodiesterase class I)
MRAEGGAHAAWPEMLRAALAGDGVRAVYQPIVDLARGVVVGYEALVRFAGHPVESPEPWFAAAHAHGCGAELQAAALRAALRHRRSLPRNCFLTVNVGPEVLCHPAIQRVWADEGDLNRLIVELTEHFAVDDHAALQTQLDGLRTAGALIAIDDAGSGYAGLSQLLAIRPAMIKLDRALIQDIDHDEAKRALVEMVGTFAGRVDAWLLAEGIERQGELETLAALHVPLAQGYHLGRPAQPWAPAIAQADRPRADRSGSSLRRLLEHPPVVTDPGQAIAAFRDPAVDLIVLCDDDHRPIAGLDDRSAPVATAGSDMKVNLDTSWSDAALRAITRTGADWARPLLCTDNAGRYVGVVRIPRLLHALSTP